MAYLMQNWISPQTSAFANIDAQLAIPLCAFNQIVSLCNVRAKIMRYVTKMLHASQLSQKHQDIHINSVGIVMVFCRVLDKDRAL